MKSLVVSVIVCIAIICGTVSCESAKIENDAKTSESVGTVKTKRGILHYGYGGGNALNYAPLHLSPASVHRHAFAPSLYASVPGVYKNVLAPTLSYALSHGGATTHSYNVNYPKYHFVPARPVVHINPGRPAVAPAPLPIHPLAVVPAPKPIIPVSYPVYANRVPFVLQKPVFVQRPVIPAPAPIPVAPAPVPLAPAFPIRPTVAQVPHYHINQLPAVPGPSIHPQLVPVNPQLVPGPSVFGQPDGWRPIVGYPQLPLTPTAAVNPPSVALLPPATAGAPVGPSPTDVQPTFSSSKPPGNFYLTPSEGQNSLEQQQISNEELAQTQGKF